MPRRILSSFACLLALGLAGCSDGGGGDPLPKAPAAEFGTCPHLSTAIGPANGTDGWEDTNNMTSDGCHYPPDATVCASGLTLSAIDNFDETGTGSVGNYYVQDTVDDPPAYSGSTIFGPSFSPPDLRLFNGDVIDFFGTKSEFPGPSSGLFSDCRTLPELEGTVSFRFDGTGQLAPKTIKIDDIIGYDNARRWLGMLVRIEDVDVLTASGSCTNLPTGCRYSANLLVVGQAQSDVPQVANELYDLKNEGPDLTAPTTHFKAITGIVTYFYSFHIDPRSPADFEQ